MKLQEKMKGIEQKGTCVYLIEPGLFFQSFEATQIGQHKTEKSIFQKVMNHIRRLQCGRKCETCQIEFVNIPMRVPNVHEHIAHF